MNVGLLNQRHPSYDAALWCRLRDLYEGGDRLMGRVAEYLPRRPKEPPPLWKDRQGRAVYTNYLGSIIDFFVAWLFSSPPEFTAEPDAPDWYPEVFFRDADRGGSDFASMLREVITDALITRTGYLLVDMPPMPMEQPRSRAEETDLGLDRAYLVQHPASAVLDWELDERGRYAWAVIHTTHRRRAGLEGQRDKLTHRWTYWDQESYRVFEAEVKLEDGVPEELRDEDDAKEVRGGPHSFGEVPLVALELPAALWAANKLESQARAHLRAESGEDWALEQGAYEMPVLFTNTPAEDITVGEGYFLRLGPEDKVEMVGHSGKAFEALRQRQVALRQEMYRVVHQMALSVDQSASQMRASGESKRWDASSTEVVLGRLGEAVIETAKRVLDLVAKGRKEQLSWTVQGFDTFDVESLEATVGAANLVHLLDIPSPTFRREHLKRVALRAVDDAPPDVKAAIKREIDEAVGDELPPPPMPAPGREDREEA